MFWIEVLLMLFPLVVLRVAKLRNDSRMLFLSALSALLGCATWRLTYSLVAFNPGGGYAYFPTWEELLISIGLWLLRFALISYSFVYCRYFLL